MKNKLFWQSESIAHSFIQKSYDNYNFQTAVGLLLDARCMNIGADALATQTQHLTSNLFDVCKH